MFRAYQRAFTLIELFIVLALLAILAQIAIPALQDFIERNQQQTLRDQIARAVQQARAHAVSQRTQVELCGSRDGVNCHSDWSQGWLIREVKTASILYITQLDPNKPRLKWSGFQPSINFYSNGINPTGNGRFYSCYQQQINWQLILNRQGRLRLANHSENQTEAARCR